ncbi:MAG: 9-O-acetylesterase [Ferruginibacter sp.]|nr:9-O-acetylesterase [Ferruginibacter sp.]
MKKILLFVTINLLAYYSNATIILPNFFTDNMVLQRNTKIPIWGWASANEKIIVQFHKQTKITKANKEGKWLIYLNAEKARGSYTLTVKGENEIVLKNILVGDVRLCSGQSNMEWTVGQSDNAKIEVANATNSMIRHIKIPKQLNSLPQPNTTESKWEISDPNTVANFTGVGYFFASKIYAETKIPIGLINASWGGTNIETWISREAFESSPEFATMIAAMPKINLDSIVKLRENIITTKIEKLQNAKIDTESIVEFTKLDFDDSECPTLLQPQLWEQQALGELDGIVWIRKTIELTKEDINKPSILELSKIDDADITFVNGVQVGKTNQWDAKRKYEILPHILKEGKNYIVIKIIDNGGGGGIYGDSNEMKLTIDKKAIPLYGNWKYRVESIKKSINENAYPSLCFNAMINPLLPYAIKGILWYQGESNAGRAYQYRKAFPLLINDWRRKFNQPLLPFYYVQLASFYAGGNSNKGCGWAELREAQTMALSIPHTGMVVTTDLVTNPKDIHPTNKQGVGSRLASIALQNLYNKQIVCIGPSYKSMSIKGSNIVVSFNNIGSGLYTSNINNQLNGFEIAGKDSIFYPAKAFIKDNVVVVSSENVINPIAVNYAWMGDATNCNLFNKEGFPAIPFRSKEWITVTKKEKYLAPKLN